MERSPQPDSFELSDYVAVLRRRWWIVVLAGLVGLAAAAAYTVLTPATYTSTATVYVRAMSTDARQASSKNTGGVDLDTEAQFVQSASVASLAKQKMNSSQSVTSLLSRVSVTVPANSQVLQISCTGSKATAAAQCANAFAAAYLQNRSAAANDLIQTQLSALQQRENTLRQKITTVTLKIKALARGVSVRITLSTELSSLENQMNLLSGHTASLVAQSANLTGGTIITDAVVPRRPSNPRPSLYLPSGLAVGLLIGLVIAFWRDRSDRRVRGARDVETAAHLPVLLDLSHGKVRPQLALVDPRSRTGQAFAELGHSLVATLGQGNHVVLVAGATPGHGSSMAAANLAAALARTGSEAILVCADLRGSITPALFGLSEGAGLAQVVIDRATVSEVERHPAEVPQLRVITPGVDGHLANYHLQRDVTERLVDRLRARARYVIFEAPPTADGADVYALAQLVDAAVMVVEVPRSLREEVLAGVRQLDRMGAAVLGAVLLPSFGKARPPAVPDPPAAHPQAAHPQDADPRAGEPRTDESRAGKPRATKPRSADTGTNDHRTGDPRATEPWSAEPVSAELGAAQRRRAAPGAAAPGAAEPRAAERRAADLWAADLPAADPDKPRGRDRYREPYAPVDPEGDIDVAEYLVYPPRGGAEYALPSPDDEVGLAPGGPSAWPVGIRSGGAVGRAASDRAAASDRGTASDRGAASGWPRPELPSRTDDGIQADGAPDTTARG
jgi:capsular polysaccharide biosynthesis protein/Mrp family chromosome partitioning ATPase